MRRTANSPDENGVVGLDCGYWHHVPPGAQPCSHFWGVEDLPLLHHRQNEGLGHAIAAALRTMPLFPTRGTFHGVRMPCANQTRHKSPLLVLLVGRIGAGKTTRIPLTESSAAPRNSDFLQSTGENVQAEADRTELGGGTLRCTCRTGFLSSSYQRLGSSVRYSCASRPRSTLRRLECLLPPLLHP